MPGIINKLPGLREGYVAINQKLDAFFTELNQAREYGRMPSIDVLQDRLQEALVLSQNVHCLYDNDTIEHHEATQLASRLDDYGRQVVCCLSDSGLLGVTDFLNDLD